MSCGGSPYVPLTAVGIVLVIACANVAGLLLARAAARRKEIATRLALGAGRVRVIRQLLTESLVLSLAGGVAGLAVGSWLTSGLRSLLPERVPLPVVQPRPGARLACVRLHARHRDGDRRGVWSRSRAAGVSSGHRSGVERGARVGRAAAVLACAAPWSITQVALSVILLIAAGLCVRTLRNAVAIDTGYDAGSVLTVRMDLVKQRYSEARGLLPSAAAPRRPEDGARRHRRRVRGDAAVERRTMGERRPPRGRPHTRADVSQRRVTAVPRRDEHPHDRGPRLLRPRR